MNYLYLLFECSNKKARSQIVFIQALHHISFELKNFDLFIWLWLLFAT